MDKETDKSLNVDFSEIDYSLDAVSAEKKLKKAQQKNSIIIFSIILSVIFANFYRDWKVEASKTYIEGNVLKIARSGAASVGNPWKNASFVGQLTFRSLFLTDSGFSNIEPELAKSYEVTEDGLTYIVTLKEGEKWSDGSDFTVDDVVFSIESFLLCSNVNSIIETAFNKIKGASQFKEGKTDHLEGLSTDGNDIIIELEMPHSSFALTLTQFVPLPKHILQYEDPSTFTSGIDFFLNPVCTGMFMVDCTNEDGDLELIHNPHYSDKQTDIERVILYGAYKTMNIDHYSTTNITEMVSYRSMTGFTEYSVNVYFYRYFVFNMMAGFDIPEQIPLLDEDGKQVLDENGEVILTDPPSVEYDEDRPENVAMQDVKVRQAITHAIDIETLLSEVYFGTGNLVYGGSQSLAKEVYEFNPEKAKKLLIEADYDFDRPFTIGYYHTDNNTTVFLQRVQQYLEDIGLTVRLVRASGNTALYETREYDMFLKALSAFNTQEWYTEFLSTNTNFAALYGTQGEFDDLVQELGSTSGDVQVFMDTLTQLVQLEQSLVYKIPLFSLSDSVYINSNRLHVPDNMTFGNTRYRSDLRVDEWFIKKG